ncbi:hypothetical protein PHLGIDRAFT_425605 [Phlebiopsis gigantea 11061_1 CR5-6]|uniref:Domain of unknown function at the cortex 1 domain-containing protein n=1 Tax=Phlebiopsis gigantea (strain 11061_1 CR5-6) TaxID=745531 RepID=A0A0C3RYP2_PHLG1|nr:hypothetical protein PHLGIDRAFT_425605 [Phlebiopsis gigantea 11061_1 CR5-6]
MPRLRILAGPSPTDLNEIRANSGQATHIATDAFEGDVAVCIKNFADTEGNVHDSAYFKDRTDVTWSIQVQGRFLQEHSADEILFGNVFDRALPIPWGFSAILSFMQYMDPCMEQDLQSKEKPWALSPLMSTMTYFAHTRTDGAHQVPPFPPPKPVQEDTSQLRFKARDRPPELQDVHNPSARRTYCQNSEHRTGIILGPNDLITQTFATTTSPSVQQASRCSCQRG